MVQDPGVLWSRSGGEGWGDTGLDKSHSSEKDANTDLRLQELCPGLLHTMACSGVGKGSYHWREICILLPGPFIGMTTHRKSSEPQGKGRDLLTVAPKTMNLNQNSFLGEKL